ncbi:peptide-methionine (S)-S-oxide reductase [Salinicoccus sesuvii]|uniref:Peptide methionine sulfoxide reductase MsrA n=1 Tax=Salinicoccus sesuvii TaxID=868281 RepID=A0ABV7N382_9STAP
METVYFAGGCLWGVQAFLKTLPGVQFTEAGRANGQSSTLNSDYDGYVECVKTIFDPKSVTLTELMEYFFEIIDPYSLNKQGDDVGEKYRTGVYSKNPDHLKEAESFINKRDDHGLIMVEILPLTNYVRSAEEHQDRLSKHPNDYCHIPQSLLEKYLKVHVNPED